MYPLYNIMVYGFWFLATYYVIFMLLVLFLKRKELFVPSNGPYLKDELVSILVPAFNEEHSIAHTIASLKKMKHLAVEFIILNDGSKDNTSRIVRKHIENDSRFVFIDNSQNKGKAACLNQGIEYAKGKYIATIDADSVVEPGVFAKILPYFSNPKVGAVTISVELKETKSFLSKIIDIEYHVGLSLFLKIQSFFNGIYVTPGPFSVYRRNMLLEIGSFDITNITEDYEIAYRIHKAGYRIENCLDAKVHTITPESFKALYKQRRRWYSGALQTVLKHKDMLFNKKYGAIGFFIPFSFCLIFGGIILFFSTIFFILQNSIKTIEYYQYVEFDLWREIANIKFDLLRTSTLELVGISGMLTAFVILFIGFRVLKVNMRRKVVGIVAWPLMYYLYQIFWISAIYFVVMKKKVSWR